MKIGGGQRESSMVLLPIVGLALVVTVMMGGPDRAFAAAEQMLFDAWDWLALLARR